MQKILFRMVRSIIVIGFTCIFLVMGRLVVLAQDIDFSSCPNPQHIFTEVPVGVEISPALEIEAIAAPAVPTMSILNVSYDVGGFEFGHCNPCTNSESLFGVDINASGSMVTIDGTPDPSALGYTIIFTIRATANATQCDRAYRLPLGSRDPLALAVVLDRSGSMGWGYDGNFSPPANERRWDGLVTGLGAMSSQLGLNFLLTEDSLGMVLFATNLVASPAPFNVDLTRLQITHSMLEGVASGLTPGGNTALGDGILEARDRLIASGTSTRKVMIVFSDGVQNTGDKVKTSNPNIYVETEAGQNISDSGEIDIYTICLGSSGHNPVLMQGIADENGGEYLGTSTGAEAHFVDFFSDQMVNILSGSSPQFIDRRKSSFPAPSETGTSSAEETFSVNKGSRAVIVTLIAPNRNEPHFTSLVKDGTELIQYAQQTSGSGYATIGLRLPVTGLPVTSLDGEWTVKMQASGAKAALPYTISMITDDHAIKPLYKINKKFYKVDDTLSAIVDLKKLGLPLDNAQVKVLVGVPGDDVNNLIALANVDFDPSSVDPGSPDVAKLAILLNDPEFLEKIKTNEQLLNLTYDATQKVYTSSFSGLDVTGVYQLFYSITFDDPQLGKIRRFHQRTVYVRFPDVDLPNSNVTITPHTSGSLLNWRPIASNGNLIGSGWGGAIGIDGASILEVTDHGDGSYSMVLNVTPDKEVTVNIADEEVYQGKLEDMGGGQCKILNIPCWLFWLLVILLIIIIIWLIRRNK